MSYLVFARKWRPQTFDDIVGQEHVATTLKNAIKMDRVAHAYLFAGSRGVGKTSTARILAKALNCEKGPTANPCNKCASCVEITRGSSLDVLEIDGASNRGVDEVRNLRENVKLSSAHGKYKVYIIDEVHMLTPEAFNALLKTLEEPPAHVKFIFATTQPYKLISTIISRCQRFDFRKIGIDKMARKLEEIAKDEKISIDKDAIYAVARASDGSMRDAESILDQLGTFSKKAITLKDVQTILGVVEQDLIFSLTDRIIKNDAAGSLKFIDEFIADGRDPMQLIEGMMSHFRNLLIARQGTGLKDLVDMSGPDKEALYIQAEKFSTEDIFYVFNILSNTQSAIRSSRSPRLPLEMAVAKLACRGRIATLDEILARLDEVSPDRKGDFAAIKNESGSSQIASVTSAARPEKADGAEPESDAYLKLERIKSAWPAILKQMRIKKMSAASFLLEATPVEFKDSVCTIAFPDGYSFHKENLERNDNRSLLEEIMGQALDEETKVSFIISAGAERKALSAGDVPLSAVIAESAAGEPLVRSALDLFRGRLVE